MSGKPCVGVCRQGIVGRAEVGLSEGKHAYLSFPLCGSIWPTSQTYVSNGCGLHGGMRGGDVSSYEKVVPMNFNRQQNATWVTVTPRSSVLPFGLSRITGRANTYSRWEERGEHSGSRMHMGSTEGEELQELSLFSLAKVSPASAAPPPSGKYKNDLTSSPCHASLLAQYGGAVPRLFGEHKEMLPQALLQEYKRGPKSKGAMTIDDCLSISAASLEGSIIAALAAYESILVTSQCARGECYYPFLPRAGGTLTSAAGKRPGREQQWWGAHHSFPRPLLRRPQPTCHGGTVRRCGGQTLPSPCSPLAEKGAPHLRVLQFQSFIWVARLTLPFPTGITQARRLFQVHPSCSF